MLIRTEKGKKKRIVERERDREMYDYLDVGDRVSISSRTRDI